MPYPIEMQEESITNSPKIYLGSTLKLDILWCPVAGWGQKLDILWCPVAAEYYYY